MNLIAETAWHHDGDFKFFKNLVNRITKETKADFIKFHITLDIDEYMHSDHPAYEWARERIFTEEEWDEIFQIPINNGKKLMLLFNDKKAVSFGMKYNPELVEIHSVCLNDINLLIHLKNEIKNCSTNIVLGVGGTDLYEIENAINILNSQNIIMMHGFQNYPTKYENINFSKIKKIMLLYPSFKHGYADHTAWNNSKNVLITLLGAAIGMDYIEKHITTTTGEGRTDWQAAVSLEDFIKIQEGLNVLKVSKGDGLLKMNKGEKSYSTFGVMKKAAILNKDVQRGGELNISCIDFKRTGQSSDLSQLDVINSFGKCFTRDLEKNYCINKFDLE